MYANNAFNVYKNNSVNHASKDQLLLMLVDGAVKFAKMAREGLEKKDIQKSHENLIKTQDIFTELMVSLDQNAGDWAKSMYSVYDFIKTSLFKVNMKKDLQAMDEILPLIINVRDIWYEAYEKAKGMKR